MRQDLVHCSGPILEIYKALPQPLSETKERANSCLVKAAERDVGVVDGLTSDHLVMCPFQVPPSRFRAFLPTEFTKARDSSSSRLKVRCFPKPKRRTCDRIDLRRNLRWKYKNIVNIIKLFYWEACHRTHGNQVSSLPYG